MNARCFRRQSQVPDSVASEPGSRAGDGLVIEVMKEIEIEAKRHIFAKLPYSRKYPVSMVFTYQRVHVRRAALKTTGTE
jgi:hypothetical protein